MSAQVSEWRKRPNDSPTRIHNSYTPMMHQLVYTNDAPTRIHQ